jgi:signal transduction histidine kinase
MMPALRRPLPLPPTVLGRALITAGALLLAMGVRLALTPWLGDRHPVTLVVPAIVAVSIACGVRWALLMALLALAWVATPWLPPTWPDEWSDGQRAAAVVVLLAAAASGFVFERATVEGNAVLAGSSPRLSATERAMWVSTALALVLPLVLLHAFARSSRDAALDAATQGAESALRIAAEHVSRIVQGNEIIARQVQAEVARMPSAQADGAAPGLHKFLAELARGSPHLNSLWVMDADGYPVASSLTERVPAINYADREYFVFHLENRGRVYVSRLLLTRSTQELFFDISTRRETPDGRFRGVVNVTLRPAYFVDFFREITASRRALTITLLRDDGYVLARSDGSMTVGDRAAEPLIEAMAKQQPGGWLTTAAGGKDSAHTVLRSLEPFPLYVAVALDRNEVMQRWRDQVALLGSLALLAAFALLAGLWTAWQRTLNELRALERLAQEAEQRRRAEAQLHQAQKVEALGHLTGSVAHDFNNVLGVLQNQVALLAHTHPELAERTVGPMQRAIRSGEHLTRKLLAFSRRGALRPERLDLAQVLPSIEGVLRMTLGSAIALSVEVAPGTQDIEADRSELELALLNLATNARAAIRGTGRVVITARPAAAHDPGAGAAAPARAPEVMITFGDDGAGMDRETLARASEPFFTTKTEGEGTGLGLTQVDTLCRHAGGTMRIVSEPGAGTSVHLYFPAAPSAAS